MRRVGHLEVYKLTLTTQGVLFIGSGAKYMKNSYLFDDGTKTVTFIREDQFYPWLLRAGKADAYEQFILGGDPQDLKNFLAQCGISQADLENLIRYQVNAGEALVQDRSLQEISAFLRDAQGRAYIPGSSLKGALRTVLLTQAIGRDPKRKQLGEKEKIPEERYLHSLHLSSQKQDAVNSILRGLSVSDSHFIPDTSMILARKWDLRADGKISSPNLVRACIAPGTRITFQLTIDRSIIKYDLVAELRNAIRFFDSYYLEHFFSPFSKHAIDVPKTPFLVLGGGSGFFSKTVIYPYLGYEDALKWVSSKLSKSFGQRHHGSDEEKYKISPHCMKYTMFRGKMWGFGVCGVEII